MDMDIWIFNESLKKWIQGIDHLGIDHLGLEHGFPLLLGNTILIWNQKHGFSRYWSTPKVPKIVPILKFHTYFVHIPEPEKLPWQFLTTHGYAFGPVMLLSRCI